MNADRFDLDSGALCLDFANTVEWHASDQPQDMLHGAQDLIAWAEAAGSLTASQAKRLSRLADARPQGAATAYEEAMALREAIYRIFARHAQAESVDGADLNLFNEALREALSHARIAAMPAGYTWDWEEADASFDWLWWQVIWSAAELLTSDRLDRVSQCADDRGCGYLFLDMSRNRSRRWCSMESCGNRAKARRHYERQQKA